MERNVGESGGSRHAVAVGTPANRAFALRRQVLAELLHSLI